MSVTRREAIPALLALPYALANTARAQEQVKVKKLSEADQEAMHKALQADAQKALNELHARGLVTGSRKKINFYNGVWDQGYYSLGDKAKISKEEIANRLLLAQATANKFLLDPSTDKENRNFKSLRSILNEYPRTCLVGMTSEEWVDNFKRKNLVIDFLSLGLDLNQISEKEYDKLWEALDDGNKVTVEAMLNGFANRQGIKQLDQ